MQPKFKVDNKNINKENLLSTVLSSNAFRSLWFGQIFSQIASNSLLFVLALRLYQVTQSNTVVSGLFLVYGIPALLFGITAGTIVDKFENRKILMLSDLSRAALVFAFLLIPHHFILIYFITLLNSIITQFYMPAEAPTIPYIFEKKYIVTANGIFTFSYFTTLAVGSILAGPLLKFFGHYGVFILISILFLIASWFEKGIPKTGKKVLAMKTAEKYSYKYIIKRLFANFKEVLQSLSKNSELKHALILLISTQVVIAILGTLGPGFADKLLKIDIRDASLIIMGPAVLGLISGALWVGTFGVRFHKKKLINTGLITGGIFLILISLFALLYRFTQLGILISQGYEMLTIIILFFGLGFSNSLLDIPANTILQEQSHGEMRGRIYGILAAAVGGVGIIPVLLGGILADIVGAGNVLLILGLIVIVYGIIRIRSKI